MHLMRQTMCNDGRIENAKSLVKYGQFPKTQKSLLIKELFRENTKIGEKRICNKGMTECVYLICYDTNVRWKGEGD